MNRTVPTARLCDTEAAEKEKRRRSAKLRAIDKGTCYDITGKLRRLVHEIEAGKHADVTDMIVSLRWESGKRRGIQNIYLGTGSVERLHFMASRLEQEMLD